MPAKDGNSNDAEWLEFVAGRAQGFIAVFAALLMTHPNPEQLLRALEKAEETGLALAIPTDLSDHYIVGMRDVIDRARDLLRQRLELQGN